jgi:predicted dehydrogenase
VARVGVVGLRRGLELARWCERVGLTVAALCDRDQGRLATAAGELPGTLAVRRWRELLAADIDGVVLANDFDEHAPLAITFLDHGVHVLSETAACTSEVEGRALLEAALRSTATYSFAENYVAHPHVRAVRKVIAGGGIGEVELVECDYLHGMSPEQLADFAGDPSTWRGRIEPTLYCTHTLSPILAVTGAEPVEVTAFAVQPAERPTAVVLVIRLSSGALAIARHGFLQGEPDSHSSWLSVRGTQGLVESVRAAGERSWCIRVRIEPWATGGRLVDEERKPPTMRLAESPVPRHDEGTVLVVQAFRDSIEKGAPPLVPVQDAVAASLVGVAGLTSLSSGSIPVAVPRTSSRAIADIQGEQPHHTEGDI